jgi:hypothetical protein
MYIKAKRTSPSRSVCVPRPLIAPGFQSARSLPTAHSTHIFASPENLQFPFIGLAKMSYTARTLGAIFFEICWKMN